jgi:hypothetical protein
MDATVEASAGDDDASYDTGAFDVAIQYADRELPDVAVPPEAGAMVNDGGFQPSDCPPWVALDSNGHAVTLITDPTQPVSADLIASVVDFVPADYAPEGGAPPGATFATTDGGVYPGVVPAADGGVCATYPYYFPGFDENCLIQGGGIAGGYPYPPAPPCNWALNLGMAQSGPGAVKGLSRYRLCVNLYNCVVSSGCVVFPHPPATFTAVPCFCGADINGNCKASPPTPAGPCVEEVQEAFEQPDLSTKSVSAILANYYNQYTPGPQPAVPVTGAALFDIYTQYVGARLDGHPCRFPRASDGEAGDGGDP